MRIVSALVIVVWVVTIAACGGGSESTEVESTSTCGELVPIGNDRFQSECTVEASDPRVAGSEIQIIELHYDQGTTESGTFIGTLELVNEDGTWSGTGTGTFGHGEASSEAVYTGAGAYDGLIYTFESGFDDDGEGAGAAIRRGTIETADT